MSDEKNWFVRGNWGDYRAERMRVQMTASLPASGAMMPKTGRRPYVAGPSDHARRQWIYADKPGLYAIRLVKHGPEVALMITHGPTCDPETGEPLDRSWYWTVFISGKQVGDPTISVPTKLYIGRALEQSEYDFLVADRQWAAEYARDTPEANPRSKPSLDTMPIPF